MNIYLLDKQEDIYLQDPQRYYEPHPGSDNIFLRSNRHNNYTVLAYLQHLLPINVLFTPEPQPITRKNSY